jgi:copper chaperone CopZ
MATMSGLALGLLLTATAWGQAPSKDTPRSLSLGVIGLFSPEREADLRAVFAQVPKVKLTAIDYRYAEITVEFIPSQAFPGSNEKDWPALLDNLVRAASTNTFSLRRLSGVSHDELEPIEMRILGLDCKACSLAAHETVVKVEGVAAATVNFREARLVALVDPKRVTRARLVEALKRLEVQLPGE